MVVEVWELDALAGGTFEVGVLGVPGVHGVRVLMVVRVLEIHALEAFEPPEAEVFVDSSALRKVLDSSRKLIFLLWNQIHNSQIFLQVSRSVFESVSDYRQIEVSDSSLIDSIEDHLSTGYSLQNPFLFPDVYSYLTRNPPIYFHQTIQRAQYQIS